MKLGIYRLKKPKSAERKKRKEPKPRRWRDEAKERQVSSTALRESETEE